MARKPRGTKPVWTAAARERSEDGVDLTLVRWMLSLTPLERLRAAQSSARSLLRLRARQAKVRLLDLETLIQTKQEAAGEKDVAVLTILRRILAERRSP